MIEELRDRVRALVEIKYPDGAARAAEVIGIPQPTLHTIIVGTTTNPRSKTLQAIADHFGTTVGWLLDGSGPLPPALRDEGDMPATTALLSSLGVNTTTLRGIVALGSWLLELRDALRTDARIGDGDKRAPAVARIYGKQAEARRQFDEAIALELESFVAQWGQTRAREQLQSPAVQAKLVQLRQPLLNATRVPADDAPAAERATSAKKRGAK